MSVGQVRAISVKSWIQRTEMLVELNPGHIYVQICFMDALGRVPPRQMLFLDSCLDVQDTAGIRSELMDVFRRNDQSLHVQSLDHVDSISMLSTE